MLWILIITKTNNLCLPPNSSKVTLDWSSGEVDGFGMLEAASAWAVDAVSSTGATSNLSVAAPSERNFVNFTLLTSHNEKDSTNEFSIKYLKYYLKLGWTI